LVHA